MLKSSAASATITIMGTLVTHPGRTYSPPKRPLVVAAEITREEDLFEGHPGGAFRGFVFAMLFNLLLLLGGSALWLLLRR